MRKSIKLAVVGATAFGIIGAAAAPAFADSPASDSAQATVTVNKSISFAFDGSPSFALDPNVLNRSAVAFTVATNAPHGYQVSLAAQDLTNGGALSIPASDLQYTTLSGGSDAGQGTVTLGNSPTIALTKSQPGAADHFTQDWKAVIPANTPPAAYSTQITYVATTNL